MGLFSWSRGAIHFPALQTDLHSHLLPAVDDGAENVGDAIELVRSLQSLGYKKLITTPHIYQELYPNSLQTLEPAFARLNAALTEAGIDLPVRYAAEYFMDDYLDDLLKRREPLLTIHDNWVLVEMSFVQPPPDLDRRLFGLQVAGYKPILAHPERYNFWHADMDSLHGLKERGMLFQVNLLSLTGYYGKGVAEAARRMCREDLVDLFGTDCHHERHVAALKRGSSVLLKWVDPLIRKDRLLNAAL